MALKKTWISSSVQVSDANSYANSWIHEFEQLKSKNPKNIFDYPIIIL